MSVDPVATAEGWTAARKTTSPGAAPNTSFQEVLNGSPRQEESSAATAAEILRLKMLSSAVALGDGERSGAGSLPGLQRALHRFLEQMPQSLSGAGAVEGRDDGKTQDDAEAAAAGGPTDATDAIILKASRRYGIDGGLIRAVIRAESDFNPRAVSSAGAKGLMQLMPSTARSLGVSDPFDPEQNVMAGTRFLKDMLSRYGGDIDQALAAYNWGPGNVDRHGLQRLPQETRAYLAKVKGYLHQHAT